MDSQWAVDENNKLLEVRPEKGNQPLAVRIAARVISYVFHPLFIPVYLAWLIIKTQSYLFGSFSPWEKFLFIARFGVIYIMFPLVSVLLMKGLGFIKSIHLKTQRDRIIPYVACMIYYWWMWYVLHNQPEYPKEFVVLSLSIFLASIAGLMANINMKVSMHAIAAGIMASFVMLLGLSQYLEFGAYISLTILVAGVICTARFIDSDHTPREIYTGLFIGIASLFIALKFT